MQRIDNATAATTLPTPAAPGTPGYFTDGNPAGGVPATVVPADWLNLVQEELLNVIAAAGITPSKTAYNQLVSAIKALTPGRLLGVRKITSTQVHNETPGTKYIVVDQCGGGAGGAGTVAALSGQAAVGGGGGAGARATALITSGFSGVTVTIGAGGTAGVGAPGGNGGTTSFGTLVVTPGGAGADQAGSQVAPNFQAQGLGSSSPGGTASLLIGAAGGAGVPGTIYTAAAVLSGKGADSPFGGGSGPLGSVVTGSAGTASAAQGYGAGGGGGFSTSGGSPGGGGPGAPGVCFVYEYSGA